MRTDLAKRLKTLEKENARSKQLLADAEPDQAILKAAALGNFYARQSDAKQSNMHEMHSGATAFRSVALVGYSNICSASLQ